MAAFVLDIVRHVVHAFALYNTKLIWVYNPMAANYLLFLGAFIYAHVVRFSTDGIACSENGMPNRGLLLYYIIVGTWFIVVVIGVCSFLFFFNIIRN